MSTFAIGDIHGNLAALDDLLGQLTPRLQPDDTVVFLGDYIDRGRDVRGELDWIVMKALEKDRNRRYETANGFALDVQRYLADEPVLACPPSAAYRLRKVLRRNKGPALATGLVLLALVGGVIGTTIGMLRAGKAERDAADAQAQAERERDAAVEARQETFDALIDLTGFSAADALARNSAVSQQEREFFERVAARYERLVAELPDTAETRRMRAQCLQQVGSAYFYVGDYDRALKAYHRWLELLRGLRDQFPDDPVLARMLTSCLAGIAATYGRLKRQADYERTLGEAVVATQEALHRFPSDRDVMRTLAVLQVNRGLLQWQDHAVRLAEINRAISLAESSLQDHPDWHEGRDTLATALEARGAHFAELGSVEQVRTDAARLDELSLRGYTCSVIELAQCRCYRHLGHALVSTGSAAAAVAAYRRAAPILEAIIAKSPGNADARTELILCYEGLQNALQRAGQGEESERYSRLVLRLKEGDAEAGNESAELFADLSQRAAALALNALAAGQMDEARQFLDRAIRYDRQCLEVAPLPATPETPEARAELRRAAGRSRELAQAAQRLERTGEAIEFTRRQLEFARAAIKSGKQLDSDLFTLLLTGHQVLTPALLAAGEIADARAAWDETLRVIAWSDPGSINDAACHKLAELVWQLAAAGQAPDPAAVLGPGLAERQARLTSDAEDAEARRDLRRGYRALGLVLELTGRFQEADNAFARVIDVAPVPPNGPDQQVKDERHLVFGAYIGRAVCQDALDNEADAEAAWQALSAYTGNTASAWSQMRLRSLARNCRIERALQFMWQAFPSNGDPSLETYNAACVHAIASTKPGLSAERKEELARRAVELLEEAKAAGYFDATQQVEHAKSDGDLDALRGRADFQLFFDSIPQDVTPHSESLPLTTHGGDLQ